VKRALIWLGLGSLCLLLQAGLLPLVMDTSWRPDLLLLLVIALGLIEPLTTGIWIAVLLGGLQDTFSSTTLGLFCFILPVIYLGIRFFHGRLNLDSPLLFPFLVLLGTVLRSLLVLFLLLYLAEAGAVWNLILPELPRLLLANTLTGLVLGHWIMTMARGRRPYEV